MKKHLKTLCIIVCVIMPFLSACSKEEKTVKQQPIKEDDKTIIHLTVCGDVLIEAPNYMAMDEGYSFGNYFDAIKPYLKGDLVIGNEEVPLGGEELGIAGADYQFNAPAQIAGQLKALGFDVMTFANNHSYDRGMTGIFNTIKNLEASGIETTGAYSSMEESDKLLVVERKGVKIAILSYTYDTNQNIPEQEAYAVNKFLNAEHVFDEAHKEMLKQDVEAAKAQADAVIVAMHWGTEFTYALDTPQKEAAAYLNALGVDVIIGNHPHTLQTVEMLTNAEGKQTFVLYSLGNFVSGSADVDRANEQFKNMYEVGGIAKIDLIYDTASKEICVKPIKMIPIVNHFTYGYENFALLPFSSYSEELAQQHYQRYFSNAFTYAFLSEQLHQLFDGQIPWE